MVHAQKFKDLLSSTCQVSVERIVLDLESRFSQIYNIGNNANIDIRGFTTGKQKKSSDKMLPLVGIEPLAQDSKSNMLLPTLT